jgi:DNA-binding transcriptional regulator GbsR (MarR family)
MDIAGTKKRIQRVVKVAEETYKKINEVIEQLEQLQEDLAKTSEQVDHIEMEQAEQRAVLKALAEQQSLDVEEIIDGVEYPERLLDEDEDTTNAAEMATSRPSATEE